MEVSMFGTVRIGRALVMYSDGRICNKASSAPILNLEDVLIRRFVFVN